MKKGIRKMLSAIACTALAMGCLAGCGSNTGSPAAGTTTESAAENASASASEAAADSTEGTAADDKVYQIGICQLVQHEALDRATQGFEDALVKLLGEDHVQFNLQNAQGDSQTCATIANQFVNNGSDLIMATLQLPFRPVPMPHPRFLLWALLSQALPLHWILNWMTTAVQASMLQGPTIWHHWISRRKSSLISFLM